MKNMDGVKELVDLTNEVLGENSKYVAKDEDCGGFSKISKFLCD